MGPQDYSSEPMIILCGFITASLRPARYLPVNHYVYSIILTDPFYVECVLAGIYGRNDIEAIISSARLTFK